MIKKILGALLMVASLGGGSAVAAGGGHPWDVAPVPVTDKAALQNGAKLFVNYCMNCHSASLLRYNNLTQIGLTENQIVENLLFTGQKVGDKMSIAMKPHDAKLWFGAAPPDLSLMARAKAENLGQPGTDYIYTYLRTFYRDKSRDLGWNNLVFPNAGMPNPLWERQGPVEVTFTDVHEVEKDGAKQWHETITKVDADGYKSVVSDKVLADFKGHASSHAQIEYLDKEKQAQFDKDMADLTAFMGWMAEPQQEFRKTLGVWVLLFLSIFFVVIWQLNKSYWKHVK
ncbi:cytochrome c1 [Pelistega suis]|uniref:Cytochrome c1 n=1 Tax=Pelistega suis TaxID=1631957 RepID=A0A849P8G7_9BURK|nr:cytochrome c1 [Pelistega suis]MCQ9329297.1 cytochrome c1 [Pelistega suis]NOL52293.1 cytochrome c1 [Pelistega suis]